MLHLITEELQQCQHQLLQFEQLQGLEFERLFTILQNLHGNLLMINESLVRNDCSLDTGNSGITLNFSEKDFYHVTTNIHTTLNLSLVAQEIRTIIKKLEAEFLKCLKYFSSNCVNNILLNTDNNPYEACWLTQESPDQSLMIELIAKYFLHHNKIDLFESLCEESKQRLGIYVVSNSIHHPWIRRIEDTSSSCQQGKENEKNEQNTSNMIRRDNKSLLPKIIKYSNCCAIPKIIIDSYKTLHKIFHSLLKGDLQFALQWLEDQPSKEHLELLFKLRRVEFYRLLAEFRITESDILVLFSYIRNKIEPFYPLLKYEVVELITSLAFIDTAKGRAMYSQFQRYINFTSNDNVSEWIRIARNIRKLVSISGMAASCYNDENTSSSTLYYNVRLPLDSSLEITTAAGFQTLPQIVKFVKALNTATITTSATSEWMETKRIPLDIDLDTVFYYHSFVTCPICRSPDTTSRTCRLMCGHVVCQFCIDKLTNQGRRTSVRCPMCPGHSPLDAVQELLLLCREGNNHEFPINLTPSGEEEL